MLVWFVNDLIVGLLRIGLCCLVYCCYRVVNSVVI